MKLRSSVFVALVVLVIASSACRNDPSPKIDESEPSTTANAASEESEADENDEDYFYSPFVVKLDGGHFDTVSFKDVGLDRDSPQPDDPILEVISESFAYQLAHHDAFDYQGRVVYDEEMLEPSSHLHCGIKHLYVDVWQSSSPDRWGYSLWSGCSELDNFAWEEVPDTAPDGDLTSYVEPLTSSIVDALAEAARAECFQKSC